MRPNETSDGSPDVLVVGGGLIGLASAAAIAERGLRVLLLADVRRGEASPAAAGMLAPSVERASGPAHDFAVAARERYPAYLAWLAEQTGIEVPLNRLGVLQVALDGADAEATQEALAGESRWLDEAELRELEPALAPAVGAAFHPRDGAVNNLVLMRALKALLARHPRVHIALDGALEVAFDADGVGVITRQGERYVASRVVLAAGAWAPHLPGIPRPLPIEPVRGQMLSVAGSPVRHVVYGAHGYIVPRGDGRTIIGSTMEHVAFDAGTTPEGIEAVRTIGAEICPPLASARMLNGWAGLRPITPDLLPILGTDPEEPRLIYACGHSRNGILLAPLTGDVVGALAAGVPPGFDLSPFRVERFRNGASPGAPAGG